jgi:hypothetical protein
VVVFFFNMVAGTFLTQWQAIINNVTQLISILGSAIPQTATFFIW